MVVLTALTALIATVTLGACTRSRSWMVFFDSIAGAEIGPLHQHESDANDVELHDAIPEALAHNVAV